MRRVPVYTCGVSFTDVDGRGTVAPVPTTARVPKPRGRPPLAWLTAEQVAGLPAGTAVALDVGDKKALCRGRIDGVAGEVLVLEGDRTVMLAKVVRGRVLSGLYLPGDLVVRVGVHESQWRGGVVRVRGRDVLVESAAGFAWMTEAELEAPDDRSAPPSTRAREDAEIVGASE